jgi:hypothetical protein
MQALFALVALAADDPETHPEAVDAVLRASAWLAGVYDPETGYRPDPSGTYTSGSERVWGLTEQTACALLEARDLLLAAERTPPPKVSEVLREIADRFEPAASKPLSTFGASAFEDYIFQLPPGENSNIHPIRFTWYPWRLVLAKSFGLEEGTPSRDQWALEARLLEDRLPEAIEALRQQPTYEYAETVFVANLLRDADRTGRRPSVFASAAGVDSADR